jgi:dihydroorotate dehydrogenase (NAD+) catalytic subunit
LGADVKPDLAVEINGIRLKNPLLVCSGTFGNGREYSEWIDLEQLGGLMTKAVTLEPCAGNPPPRLWEVPCGLLNSIGLENPGLEKFLAEDLPWLHDFDIPVWVNVAGFCDEEYVKVCRRISESGMAAAIELNISCPNVKRGGLRYSASPGEAARLTASVRRVTEIPLYVKLSARSADIIEMAVAVVEAGADGLSLINTLPAMAIDVETGRPRLGNVTGGLSGPALHPIAVAAVWEVARAINVPIIGMGGVWNWKDAAEMMMAGADAVAVGTLSFVDPRAVLAISGDLASFLGRKGFGGAFELTDLARREGLRGFESD